MHGDQNTLNLPRNKVDRACLPLGTNEVDFTALPKDFVYRFINDGFISWRQNTGWVILEKVPSEIKQVLPAGQTVMKCTLAQNKANKQHNLKYSNSRLAKIRTDTTRQSIEGGQYYVSNY